MHAIPLTAGILLALLGASQASAQPAAQTIEVANFHFTPVPIRLAAGRPVTLTFVNASGSGHDFTSPRFFAAATVTAGAAPNGEIELAPHQTRSITLIPRAGTYHAHCSHFLHKQMGMTDEIIVN